MASYVLQYKHTVVYPNLKRVQDAVTALLNFGAKGFKVLKVDNLSNVEFDEANPPAPEHLTEVVGEALFSLFEGKQAVIEVVPKSFDNEGSFAVTLFNTGIPVKATGITLRYALEAALNKELIAKKETVQLQAVTEDIEFYKAPEQPKISLRGFKL